ncbi:SERUM RESPONSE FACTOR-like protein [Salix koriyanagi]|uniref:SERUM RESPONSE FACTOR-like protein n=1 Tax=Salix koriyanagi TaxID=2511006 RepID=A0A9Q0WJH2_9ROSI|nr:SERUM RESPONSE FACTOR-like protein [Salix koriyanagi]
MAKTIEKYQTFSFGALEVNQSEEETQNNYQEYLKLKAGVDELQRSQRNLLGEDLGNLGTDELDQLENQLDSSLKHISIIINSVSNNHFNLRTQFILDQLSELQRKEELLLETNNALKRKLEETTAANRLSWKAGDERVPYSFQHFQPYDSVEPLQYSSTSQIGYNPAETDQATATTSTQNVNGFIPGWML